MKPEYDFISNNGGYTINRTGFPFLGVMGVGSYDRKTALKQAKEYCKQRVEL